MHFKGMGWSGAAFLLFEWSYRMQKAPLPSADLLEEESPDWCEVYCEMSFRSKKMPVIDCQTY